MPEIMAWVIHCLVWFMCLVHAEGKTLFDELQGQTVLAFGDSLTNGMYVTADGEWRKTHPYALKLSELINEKTKNTTTVLARGINGERTESMVGRLPSKLDEAKATVVIILGGTNNLGDAETYKPIYEDLKSLHFMALNSSMARGRPVYTMALTMPQNTWKKKNPQVRKHVNMELQNLVNQCSERMMIVDLDTYFDTNVRSNLKKYWSVDTVHLSIQGYDYLAELIFKKMKAFEIPSDTRTEYSCQQRRRHLRA